jgi:hypothetical protein
LPELLDPLNGIGLFGMLVPRSQGGLEIDFPPSIDILAALRADVTCALQLRP